MTNKDLLGSPLLHLDGWPWTMRMAVEGLAVLGGIGSGKTSGSGRAFALKFLKAGMGGLILTVKSSEKDLWLEYCRIAGREKDLVLVEPGSGQVFNFLEYESSLATGSALTHNLVQTLMTVVEAGREKSGGRSDEAFWQSSLEQLTHNVIDLCKLAYGTVSIPQIYEIAQSLPQKNEDGAKPGGLKESWKAEQIKDTAYGKAFNRARRRLQPEIDAWLESLSAADKAWMDERDNWDETMAEALPNVRLFNFVNGYFEESYIGLAEKTRSIIDISFSTFLYRLLRDPAYSLFAKGSSTFTPEDATRGKIILLNLPVKLYNEVGRDCQVLVKYLFQRAMERREIRPDTLPVFIWADEAQNFLHQHDTDFQATARESRIATVYLSQNLSNYYSAMGGDRFEHRVKSFLGTLATKVFHANADMETNEYSSKLIGDDYFESHSAGRSVSNEINVSANISLVLERVVRPEEFVSLKTGGPENNFKVQAYIHRQGVPPFNGANHALIAFDQHFKP